MVHNPDLESERLPSVHTGVEFLHAVKAIQPTGVVHIHLLPCRQNKKPLRYSKIWGNTR